MKSNLKREIESERWETGKGLDKDDTQERADALNDGNRYNVGEWLDAEDFNRAFELSLSNRKGLVDMQQDFIDAKDQMDNGMGNINRELDEFKQDVQKELDGKPDREEVKTTIKESIKYLDDDIVDINNRLSTLNGAIIYIGTVDLDADASGDELQEALTRGANDLHYYEEGDPNYDDDPEHKQLVLGCTVMDIISGIEYYYNNDERVTNYENKGVWVDLGKSMLNDATVDMKGVVKASREINNINVVGSNALMQINKVSSDRIVSKTWSYIIGENDWIATELDKDTHLDFYSGRLDYVIKNVPYNNKSQFYFDLRDDQDNGLVAMSSIDERDGDYYYELRYDSASSAYDIVITVYEAIDVTANAYMTFSDIKYFLNQPIAKAELAIDNTPKVQLVKDDGASRFEFDFKIPSAQSFDNTFTGINTFKDTTIFEGDVEFGASAVFEQGVIVNGDSQLTGDNRLTGHNVLDGDSNIKGSVLVVGTNKTDINSAVVMVDANILTISAKTAVGIDGESMRVGSKQVVFGKQTNVAFGSAPLVDSTNTVFDDNALVTKAEVKKMIEDALAKVQA